MDDVKAFYPTFYKTLRTDILRNYGLDTTLSAILQIIEELNTNNDPYLNTLSNDLKATLDNYRTRNNEEAKS